MLCSHELIFINQECCLCTLRGGALKPTLKPGQWAHVVCALVIKEVKFENIQKREPINTSKIPFARMKLVSFWSEMHVLLDPGNCGCDEEYVFFPFRFSQKPFKRS